MKIKAKLQAVAVLPLVVFCMAAAIDFRVTKATEGLYARGAAVIGVYRTTQNLVNLTYEYSLTHGERAETQWRSQYAQSDRLLAEMPALFGLSAAAPQFIDLRRHYHHAGKLFDELLAFDNRGQVDESKAQALAVRSNVVNRLILELQTVLPLTDQMHSEIVSAIKHSMQQGALLTEGIIFILSISLLTLAMVVISGIQRSLARVQQGMERVAGGDLGYRVNLATRDELGDLARGFDAMAEKLSQVTVSRDVLVKEVAERRHAEDALSASEAQLKEAQRLAQLGSWQLDLTTNALHWSEEIFQIFEIDPALFGATYEAFLDAIPPEDRERVNQAYTDSLVTRAPYEIEHRLLMQDGRIKYVHERCVTYFADDGTPLRSVGTVQDVTARRLAEEEVSTLNAELEKRVALRTQDLLSKTLEVDETQRALMNIVEDLNNKTLELEEANFKLQDVDRLKSLFIASMSHELRTPLNSIIGFSSIVLGEWLGPLNDEQKGKIAIVLRTGKHLLSLINDLIDISKVEAGKLESTPEAFDLHDLITEAASMSEAEIRAKGISLQVEDIHLTMHTDKRRLYQCLVNLIGNAAKFTRQGTITIRVAVLPGQTGSEQVAISVQDTGIGIREEDLPKLFASFVRLPLPEDMQAKGTGLGLYLVKKIATEILMGTVSVSSVYGQGSEFVLTVPVVTKGPVA